MIDRIPDIMAALQERDLDGMLLIGPVNRRWATGFASSAGALVITAAERVFFTDSRYIESAEAYIQHAKVVQVGSAQSYAALIREVLERNHVRQLGFEEGVMTQAAYTDYRKKLAVEFVPAQKLIGDLRAAKTPTEYALMRHAQAITEQTFDQILPLIVPERTERELAAEIVYHLMKNGAERPAFDPIVASGPRSSMPHATPGDHKLTGFITLDFGAVYRGYCSDMTRTVALGEPTKEMCRVYEIVLAAQTAGIAAARAGVAGREIDRAARNVIKAAGFGDYFGHGFGHGLGLEVHESPGAAPASVQPLPAGAVISAEPGIYLPGKFGVRIEDTLYLTETGCEILTQTPKTLMVL